MIRSLLLVLLCACAAHAQTSGRAALIESLDRLAATQTAARRAEVARITTASAARSRQAHVRATMLRLIGPLPARTPLNPQILGETRAPRITIQRVLFDSQPAFHVTALLYTPDPLPPAKLPAIVMAPGHSPASKGGDFAFAAAFARAGFAVLSYDPLGQGERLQYPDASTPPKTLAKGPTGEHGEASLQPILLGESVAKYFLWDGMRAVDFLETRPEVDPKRIGAFGCSGGGSMTALLGALDTRIAATGTACYITSFDALLPAIGPQDGEQSTPGWIAAGLDFPDWIELAAPKPYAIIATESDMFPFSGAQSTEAESRRFYSLFDASPALAFIHGPGAHGNLRPILPQILAFFTQALDAKVPTGDREPNVEETVKMDAQGREVPPAGALQVTRTGQVSTSYPGASTVYTLNLAHARSFPPRHHYTATQLYGQVRAATKAVATPGAASPAAVVTDSGYVTAETAVQGVALTFEPGIQLTTEIVKPRGSKRYPVRLILADTESRVPFSLKSGETGLAEKHDAYAQLKQLAVDGNLAVWLPVRPSPAGSEELKATVLGPYYLLCLHAELTGKTLLGMRVDDTIRAIDYLVHRPDVDSADITAEASGHEALVLLHAAMLDPRLRHITLHDLPPTYTELLNQPLPQDAPQDILPGVLLHYDTPDLVRALGSRVTIAPWRLDNPGVSSALLQDVR